MKADRHGTPAEVDRWVAGWLAPTQRREKQSADRCRDCRSFIPAGNGRGEYCSLNGFSTRPGSVCRYFRAKVTA